MKLFLVSGFLTFLSVESLKLRCGVFNGLDFGICDSDAPYCRTDGYCTPDPSVTGTSQQQYSGSAQATYQQVPPLPPQQQPPPFPPQQQPPPFPPQQQPPPPPSYQPSYGQPSHQQSYQTSPNERCGPRYGKCQTAQNPYCSENGFCGYGDFFTMRGQTAFNYCDGS
jgi:hypothetical protein